MFKIGISSSFFHHDITRPIFKGKRLLYTEESMVHYVMDTGNFPILIPTTNNNLSVSDIVTEIDGLVLQGGSDVSPKSYNETPMRPEWSGDYFRDRYEIELIQECNKQNKPIFGICRGMQIINVAYGGSIYQDINTQNKDAIIHRDWDIYDQLFHEINIEDNSILKGLVQKDIARVNSIHHQAIKELGENLVIEAVSSSDGIVEAIRLESDSIFVYGVQWHPEFIERNGRTLLDPSFLLKYFFNQIKQRKENIC